MKYRIQGLSKQGPTRLKWLIEAAQYRREFGGMDDETCSLCQRYDPSSVIAGRRRGCSSCPAHQVKVS